MKKDPFCCLGYIGFIKPTVIGIPIKTIPIISHCSKYFSGMKYCPLMWGLFCKPLFLDPYYMEVIWVILLPFVIGFIISESRLNDQDFMDSKAGFFSGLR